MIETKGKGSSPGTGALQEWEAALRRELERRDPRLVEVYEVYAGELQRDCTARQVHRALKRRHGPFAKSYWTIRRLLRQVESLESDYRIE